MRMGIGLGVGINRSNYAQGIFNAYSARVVVDGGITEAGQCVDAVSGLLLNASLLLIPSGYKGGRLYSQIPTNGNGDLTWTRGSTAIRTNSLGLLESMGSGVPRLSYMYGSCPSVLLEPQRTNLALRSEEFDNASWVKTNITISANTTTSPDGSTNADKIIATTTNDLHICESSSNSFVSGTTYTFSFYAKKSENDFIQFTASSSLLSTRANFNVSNGTLGTVDAGLTASITSVTDGWYRCIVTFTAGATGSYRIIVCAITTSTAVRFQTFAGNGTSGVFIYGAQLEAGAYPTTYIPTTTATATRVADSFSRNNIFTNGLITSSGGTWFVELRNNVAYTRDAASGLEIANAGFTQRIIIFNAGGSSRLIVFLTTAGTVFTTTTDTVKLAIKWNGSNASVFANGTKVANNVTFTGLNMENLIGGQGVPFFIQQMALYPSPLSDTDCTTITTL